MEDHQTRLKRLKMRSWRRGMKEMDLILGPYADEQLAKLEIGQVDQYEELIDAPDQTLYEWVTGKSQAPAQHSEALERIKSHLNIMR